MEDELPVDIALFEEYLSNGVYLNSNYEDKVRVQTILD
jgi:hypothetical protein